MLAIDLEKDVVVVMGGGGAIGSASARIAAQAGARVAVGDFTFEAAQATADSISALGGEAIALSVDITDPSSVDEAFAETASRFGTVTGLVNAAGLWRSARSEDMTDAMWNAMMDVNVTGIFRATRAAVPYLRAAGRGAIVNISSVAAFTGSSESAPYSATKAGVLGYTYGMAGELAQFGVRVNAICPAWVDGGFTHEALAAAADPAAMRAAASSMHYLGRMADPSDVGNAVAWLLSDLAAFITGVAMYVDGGYMIKH